jgi:type IV pilus assembly protein PilV
MMNNPSISKGFSLVEVLIALFILAVGILGIIGLQLFAKQTNVDAIQRTAASALATDVVERMRMNKSALPSYISTVVPVPSDAAMPTTCGNSTAPCDPTLVAARDLALWHALISGAAAESAAGNNSGGLTTPSACIIQNPDGKAIEVGEHEYRIVIAWRGPTALTNPGGDTCGEDSTGVRYGANNKYRRIFILNAKIE